MVKDRLTDRLGSEPILTVMGTETVRVNVCSHLIFLARLQRYSQSRRTACQRTERGLEVVLYGGSP